MLGDKIRELRTQNNITQKELSEKLFVTAQAVSRWEKNEVEPSIKTLTEIAKIFNVTVDQLLAEEDIQQNVEQEECEELLQPNVEQSDAEQEQQEVEKEEKYVLAVCEQCNKPIFDSSDIVRVQEINDKVVLCKACHAANEKKKHNNAVSYGVSQRQKSWGWGIAAGVAAVLIALIVTLKLECKWQVVLGSCIGASAIYPFVACLLLRNNFVGEMVAEIASWGFVRFPGVIFELDLDGILWLLTVKLAFWILGFMIATAALILGVVLGIVVGVFVYPFALVKSYRRPEEAEDF